MIPETELIIDTPLSRSRDPALPDVMTIDIIQPKSDLMARARLTIETLCPDRPQLTRDTTKSLQAMVDRLVRHRKVAGTRLRLLIDVAVVECPSSAKAPDMPILHQATVRHTRIRQLSPDIKELVNGSREIRPTQIRVVAASTMTIQWTFGNLGKKPHRAADSESLVFRAKQPSYNLTVPLGHTATETITPLRETEH